MGRSSTSNSSPRKTRPRCGFSRDGWLHRVALYSLTALVAVAAIIWGLAAYRSVQTIEDLLRKNERLQQAILELTVEEEIGTARVLERWKQDGRLWQRIELVERERGPSRAPIREREFSLPGEEIYFDAMVVKFDGQLVMDGKERALFIWRRVFSEAMAPEDGIRLEEPGAVPERYRDWLGRLPLRHRQMFWSEIWELANQPRHLEPLGIRAIYGSAVYQRMEPGKTYRLMINSSGQIYPLVETGP